MFSINFMASSGSIIGPPMTSINLSIYLFLNQRLGFQNHNFRLKENLRSSFIIEYNNIKQLLRKKSNDPIKSFPY